MSDCDPICAQAVRVDDAARDRGADAPDADNGGDGVASASRDPGTAARRSGVVVVVDDPAELQRLLEVVGEMGFTVLRRATGLRERSVTLISAKYGLTPRETEVLEQLLNGLRYADAGTVLGIAETTVRNHAHSILKKTGLGHRDELVLLAFEAIEGPSDGAANGGVTK